MTTLNQIQTSDNLQSRLFIFYGEWSDHDQEIDYVSPFRECDSDFLISLDNFLKEHDLGCVQKHPVAISYKNNFYKDHMSVIEYTGDNLHGDYDTQTGRLNNATTSLVLDEDEGRIRFKCEEIIYNRTKDRFVTHSESVQIDHEHGKGYVNFSAMLQGYLLSIPMDAEAILAVFDGLDYRVKNVIVQDVTTIGLYLDIPENAQGVAFNPFRWIG